MLVFGKTRNLHVLSLLSVGMVAVIAIASPGWHSVAGLRSILAMHFTIANVVFGIGVAGSWHFSARVFGVYRNPREPFSYGLWRIAKCSLLVTIMIAQFLLVRSPSGPVVRALLTFLLLSIAIEVGRLLIVRQVLGPPRRVIIVGSGRRASKAWRDFRIQGHADRVLVGFIDDRPSGEMSPDIADRHIGDLDNLASLIVTHEVDELIAAMPLRSNFEYVQRSLSIAEALGVRVLSLRDVCAVRPNRLDEGDIFIELVPRPELRGFSQLCKRTIDIATAAICLAISLPLILASVIITRVREGEPVFKSRVVYGYQRKPFAMFSYHPASRSAFRGICIEKLPQFWNVLRGDMSLIGPPALGADEIELMTIQHLDGRFLVRPGMTFGRRSRAIQTVGTETQANLNIEYVHDWPLLSDLKILVRALVAEFRRPNGAETSTGAL